MKLIFTLILMICQYSNSAPHPMMGSTLINQVQNSLVFSQMGFQIKNLPSNWILKKPMTANTDGSRVVEMAPSNTSAKTILSFSSEHVSAKTDLEKYVRQYLRDYNQYGFEVIDLQSLKKSGSNSVIVDLNQKNKLTRSRQVFYKNNDQIILATCLDSFDEFSKTILTCNAVLDTFQWR